MRYEQACLRIEAVADELDRVAEREEIALKRVQVVGLGVGEFAVNYPTEQRAHAAALRSALKDLRGETP